jgi:Protein of unknown function (DUF2782)
MRKLIILSALLCGSALAAETPQSSGSSRVGKSIEPQVTIVQHSKETVEEYRIHNQLYMIKVTRNNAKPYYLVDSDGDGKLDKRRNEMDSKIMIPSWIAYK